VPYHQFAEMIGLVGIYCDADDEVAFAWEKAFAADRPVILEFKTDPEVPPLPSHINFDQAKKFMTTAIKGDPSEESMLMGAAKQLLSSILPHKS
jgi:pyruvate dehydrogenase (quinone)